MFFSDLARPWYLVGRGAFDVQRTNGPMLKDPIVGFGILDCEVHRWWKKVWIENMDSCGDMVLFLVWCSVRGMWRVVCVR